MPAKIPGLDRRVWHTRTGSNIMSSAALPSMGRAGAGAGGGTKSAAEGPDLKRRRLLDAGGPVEDDEVARRKMRDAEVYTYKTGGGTYRDYQSYTGFDPDNVADVRMLSDGNAIKAMGYFTGKGDLPMMRWLYVNGADTRDVDVPNCFPMMWAASSGRLEVCKWLVDHGAAKDIKRRVDGGNEDGFTPLCVSFGKSQARNVSRWLILNGALCKDDDDSGELDVGLMRYCLGPDFDDPARERPEPRERPELLKWAREHHQSRSSFYAFLMGTLSALPYSATKLRESLLARNRSEKVVDRLLGNTLPDEYRLLWDDLFPRRVCPLAAFCGKSGILNLIGDYVGIMRGREARIVRQLTELLPDVIIELGVFELESDESSSDDFGILP